MTKSQWIMTAVSPKALNFESTQYSFELDIKKFKL